MTGSLRLALAQINCTVGDFSGNARRITDTIEQARVAGADIVVFPELAITGYPPEDLLLKSDFLDAASCALCEVVQQVRGIAAIIGCVERTPNLRNAAIIAADGAVIGTYQKQLLPNYGVFDEQRYFVPGDVDAVWSVAGIRVGVSICEDIWVKDGPAARQARDGAQLLINISASPYHAGKGALREQMLGERAREIGAYVAYCNMVGGQDELVFDGQSMVFAPDGTLLARAAQFVENLLIVDLSLPLSAVGQGTNAASHRLGTIAERVGEVGEVYEALSLGTRDYVRKCGFESVLIGLSGGIDSALTAAIAVDALGSGRVTGVTMPTRFSSRGSIDDSRELASNLGIGFHEIPIDGLYQSFLDALSPMIGGHPSALTAENLQPRIRGTLLMALSNQFGALVLTTGNKSEVSVGYSTLYGDTAGGYAVIKDVTKTLVYRLCRYRNTLAGFDFIPRAILEKAPSAELRPDQLDTDSLPPYDILDFVLREYVEHNASPTELRALGIDPVVTSRVLSLVDRSEYKRRQSPPGVKITPRAFGKDWRVPIAHRYRL